MSIAGWPVNESTMLKTFVVHVENKPGVLTRVASLFRRRAFNIDSLTVGRTEKPEVSRMTITVDADPDQARRRNSDATRVRTPGLFSTCTTKVLSIGTYSSSALSTRGLGRRIISCNPAPAATMG